MIFLKSHRLSIALAMVLLFQMVGCSSSAPPVHYVVDADGGVVHTTEELRSQFPSVLPHWDLPDGWTKAKNDEFSEVAWSIGEGDDAPRVTVTESRAQAGVAAQFVRWRRQLSLPEISEDEAMKQVTVLELAKGTGFRGEMENDGKTIIATVVPEGSVLWVFKYTSSTAAAKQHGASFDAFCRSLKLSSESAAESELPTE